MTYMFSRLQSYYIQNHEELDDFAQDNLTNPTKIYPTHDGAANNVPALTVQMIVMMQQHLSIKHTFDDQISSVKENLQKLRREFIILKSNQLLQSDFKEKIDEIGFMVEELDAKPNTLRIFSNSTKKKIEQLTDSINELSLLSNLEIQKSILETQKTSAELLKGHSSNDGIKDLISDALSELNNTGENMKFEKKRDLEKPLSELLKGYLSNDEIDILEKKPHLEKPLSELLKGHLSNDEIDIQKKTEQLTDAFNELAISTRLKTERDIAELNQTMSSSNDGIESLISDALSELNNTGENMKFETNRDLEKASFNQKQLIPVASESLHLEQHSFDDMKESIKQKFKPIQEKQPEYNFNPILQKIFRSEVVVKRLHNACNFYPMLRIIMGNDILPRLAGVDEHDKALFKNGVFNYKLSLLFHWYSHDKPIYHRKTPKKGLSYND